MQEKFKEYEAGGWSVAELAAEITRVQKGGLQQDQLQALGMTVVNVTYQDHEFYLEVIRI